ncbi:MAG TPA: hypothetical protein PK990_09055 [Salinivirgaceae bacterium]|nr:hypothetical protein [Salinivirgaceae bacterium]
MENRGAEVNLCREEILFSLFYIEKNKFEKQKYFRFANSWKSLSDIQRFFSVNQSGKFLNFAKTVEGIITTLEFALSLSCLGYKPSASKTNYY